jgi:hypothetical protein
MNALRRLREEYAARGDDPRAEIACAVIDEAIRAVEALDRKHQPESTGALDALRRKVNNRPKRRNNDDLVTPGQLAAIRSIANAQCLNAEAECLDALKCRPDELSVSAASAFIDYLKSKEMRGVSPGQLSAIYSIAQRRTLDPQVESIELFGRDPERLSYREASALIDHLKFLTIES